MLYNTIMLTVPARMLAVLDPGLRRELQAILTLYIGTLLSGFSMGFSAVAVPDMREEMRLERISLLLSL